MKQNYTEYHSHTKIFIICFPAKGSEKDHYIYRLFTATCIVYCNLTTSIEERCTSTLKLLWDSYYEDINI